MLPLIGSRARSTTAISPGKMPAPVMLVALDADGEGGGRMLDQQLVEIERAVDVILGRRRKPTRGRPRHHRHVLRRPALDIEERGEVARLSDRCQLAGKFGDRHRQPHHLGRRSRTRAR
jgi:hypothetical protein